MRRPMLVLCLVFATAVASIAQEKPGAQEPAERPALPAAAQPRDSDAGVPLKVTLVIARFQNDKKISSLPYVLGVTTNSAKTTLRMGVEVPISTTPGGSVSYRNVGTHIDCEARSSAQPGVYRLAITVADSSVHLDPKSSGSGVSVQNMPNFRSFNSSFVALLREGQTAQYTSATDPVTGEVMMIDVTVNALK